MQRVIRLQTVLWFVLLVAMAIFVVGFWGRASAQSKAANEKPFVVEYYYKTKWGHADEFIALFKKNHYPVLKKEVELGRMLKVSAVGLPGHDRLQECHGGARRFRFQSADQADVSGSGDILEGRAAAL